MFAALIATDSLAEVWSSSAKIAPPEVLLHTDTHILETTTSNIALHLPLSVPGKPEWVTPRLDKDRLPFLDGVMRRRLIVIGVLREGEVTVQDWERAKREGTRVIGFNGLR